VEIPAEGGEAAAEKIILTPRKQRISEISVLRGGRGLIINAYDAVSNLSQLFHISLPGAETRITNDLNAYFGVSVSDDGKTIVSAQRHERKDIWATGPSAVSGN
jgi:hypothetical protein